MNICSKVALVGYSRTGKDTAAEPLIELGYKRHNFADIIKRQVHPLVLTYLGFSAFTEVDEEKTRIRHLLEHWGDLNYGPIFAEYFDTLPELAVNTKLVRVAEAEEWVKRGGTIVMVVRPGVGPATDWEQDNMSKLIDSGLVKKAIINDSDKPRLHSRLMDAIRAPNG